jgi:hypothetical protein
MVPPLVSRLGINFPRRSGEYKIVQIDIDGCPYLRFEDADSHAHSVMLLALARELGEKCPLVVADSGHGHNILPALHADWYDVRGMGWASVDVAKRTARLYGQSSDYHIGIEPKHLRRLSQSLRSWRLT